jgi:hypothetical protein
VHGPHGGELPRSGDSGLPLANDSSGAADTVLHVQGVTRAFRSVDGAVGRTPTVELARLGAQLSGRVFAKRESQNPAGSI